MAHVLYDLGTLLDNDNYRQKSIIIVNNIKLDMQKYTAGYANYASLMLKEIYPYYEVAILGDEAHNHAIQLNKKYIPNKLLLGGGKNCKLQILQKKYVPGNTMIYVCEQKVCQKPTTKIMSAQKIMKL